MPCRKPSNISFILVGCVTHIKVKFFLCVIYWFMYSSETESLQKINKNFKNSVNLKTHGFRISHSCIADYNASKKRFCFFWCCQPRLMVNWVMVFLKNSNFSFLSMPFRAIIHDKVTERIRVNTTWIQRKKQKKSALFFSVTLLYILKGSIYYIFNRLKILTQVCISKADAHIFCLHFLCCGTLWLLYIQSE